MKKCFYFIALILFSIGIIGCCKVYKLPLGGDAAYRDCTNGDCRMEIYFKSDSILTIENAKAAKSIFYAGKVFVIGDGFTTLWCGKLEKGKVNFKRLEMTAAPVQNTQFDWDKGMLKLIWTGSDGAPYNVVYDAKGKILENK